LKQTYKKGNYRPIDITQLYAAKLSQPESSQYETTCNIN